MTRTSVGEVAKDTYEDLEIIYRHGGATSDGSEAIGRMLDRILRAEANPGGNAAAGLRQGIMVFNNIYRMIKDPEEGK